MADHDIRAAPMTRAAPASFDPTTNRLAVTVSTGAPVLRRDPFTGREFVEILTISPDAVDLSRLMTGGAPVLNSHSTHSLGDVVGVVETARIEGAALVASIKLTDRPDVAGIVSDVASGVIRNVSVGYVVSDWTVTAATAGQPETRTATRWTPYEISLVAIPADPGAMTRAYIKDLTPMDTITAERHRAAEINTIARLANMPEGWGSDRIVSGVSIAQARAEALEAIEARATPRIPMAELAAMHAQGGPPVLRAIEDALTARLAGGTPSGQARDMMGLSLIDLFRAALDAKGERNTRWMKPAQILTRMGQHTTGDFPNLLQAAGSRALLARYTRAQSPLRSALARVRDVPDFRTNTLARLGEAPVLLQVQEGGEVTHGTVDESAETYSAKTFARLFALTRQAIINDDLMAFADFLNNMAAAAAETEAQQILALLTANSGMGATLADSVALFDASRANVGTGAVSVTNVATGRAAMRKTTGLDAVTPVAAEPRFLLVAPDAETLADQVVTQITPNVSTSVNPFAGTLTKLCEPRLTGAPWYLFADPADAPVIECAYLEGSGRAPILEAKDGWDVLGTEFRAVLDFGCGLVGWRGAFRSTGA